MLVKTACLRSILLFCLSFLAACAGDVSKPTPVQALSATQQNSLHTSDVTAEAKPGLTVASYDIDRIIQNVKAELAKVELARPQGAAGSTAKIKLILTEYDKGNAFARAMMAGLGQIKIDADVIFIDDATGGEIARYKVSKDFAFGGIYGASTGMEDVEQGFAKSVAEILKKD
ncbi:MAG: hypothetical protein JWO51_4509 [Rhodospirillales bacterium]|nr:hypothetical protein [Rhodospirillales bacterium]